MPLQGPFPVWRGHFFRIIGKTELSPGLWCLISTLNIDEYAWKILGLPA